MVQSLPIQHITEAHRSATTNC